MTGKICAQVRDAYNRDLCLEQRIQYTHNFLLAKAWYAAQIFPPPEACVRQLNTAIAWYILHGEIFKVPLSTLQRPKERGGWGLIHVAAKSRALYLYLLKIQGQKTETLTAEWLRAWDLHKPSINPHNRDRIPANMEYIRILEMDSAYIAPLGQKESIKAYKKLIYDTLHTLLQGTTEPADMRITRLWPNTDWTNVWKNLHTAPVPGTTKAVWYRILHDIIPTNERLHKIGISSTDRCRQCDKKDTKQHCLIECGNGEIV